MQPQFETFAWRGLKISVPRDWEPGAFSGDDNEGYVRLDDELAARCEIRWTKMESEENFLAAVKRLLDSLQQAAKKRTPARELKLKEAKKISLPSPFIGRAYRWRDEHDALLLATFCADCNRMTMLQLTEAPTVVAQSIADSLRDHADEDGTWWRHYRFALRTPNDWKLVRHNFAAGLLEMDFAGTTALHARVRRFGPAEILLKQTTPAVSTVERLEKFWRSRAPWLQPKQEMVKDNFRGHDTLRVEVERHGWSAKLARALPTWKAREQKKGFSVRARAWYCAASNRIYAVEVFAPTLEAARAAAWKIECHE